MARKILECFTPKHNKTRYSSPSAATCEASGVTLSKVKIENDEISVFNDSGIPIEVHPEYKVYIPELIFANLLTSSNYDDSQKRTTGGLNGLGAKLTAIFSQYFTVETAKDGKKYTQTFEKNLLGYEPTSFCIDSIFISFDSF